MNYKNKNINCLNDRVYTLSLILKVIKYGHVFCYFIKFIKLND